MGLRRSLGRRVGACFFAVALGTAAPVAAGAFGLDDVAKRAEEQARAPFRAPVGEVPEWLTQISYDQWRDIRFRPDRALWKDLTRLLGDVQALLRRPLRTAR